MIAKFKQTIHIESLNVRTVCNELSSVEHKAYRIGLQLGVPHCKMIVYKQQQGDDALSTAIDYWLRGNAPDVPITWNSIVEALKSHHVGEAGLAEAIATKYCCHQEEPKGQISFFLSFSWVMHGWSKGSKASHT